MNFVFTCTHFSMTDRLPHCATVANMLPGRGWFSSAHSTSAYTWVELLPAGENETERWWVNNIPLDRITKILGNFDGAGITSNVRRWVNIIAALINFSINHRSIACALIMLANEMQHACTALVNNTVFVCLFFFSSSIVAWSTFPAGGLANAC